MFKQRQPKQFSYAPKHNSNKKEASTQDLESQWNEMKSSSKRKKSVFASLPVLLIFLISIFVLLYILSRYE